MITLKIYSILFVTSQTADAGFLSIINKRWIKIGIVLTIVREDDYVHFICSVLRKVIEEK